MALFFLISFGEGLKAQTILLLVGPGGPSCAVFGGDLRPKRSSVQWPENLVRDFILTVF